MNAGNGRGRRRDNLRVVTVSVCAFLSFAVIPPNAARGGEDKRFARDYRLVVTQIPAVNLLSEAEGMVRADYGRGGRIVLLSPDMTVKNLTAGFDSAAEASVSFDGRRILFAGRKAASDAWNIYEMNPDGSGLRQVTRGIGDCRSPVYQSTFYTIVSTEPWRQLTFVGSEPESVNECGAGTNTNLYSCRLDGSVVRRLTHNLSSDMDPFVMPDGRLLFASWQRSRLDRGLTGRIALFGVNTDGADMALFSAGGGKRIMHMPCVTANGLVVFVESESAGWDGGGSLGSVTYRRPLHSYRALTTTKDGFFHSPSPLPDGAVVLSRRSATGADTYGVYRYDTTDGSIAKLFDDPEWHDIQARACFEREEPDGRSSVVTEKDPYGKLYCLNAGVSDLNSRDWLKENNVRSVRVIEGIAPGVKDFAASDGNAYKNGIAVVAQRRILGEVPIEKDGSFNIEIPAARAIELQLLDENGLALRSCGWIWAMNHEPRGCIGCHEDAELTPDNLFVDAVENKSVSLVGDAGRRRTVDFRRDVMPIIKNKCVKCHNSKHSLDFDGVSSGKSSFNAAYNNLLSGAEGGSGRYVHPGRARTSPLIWKLLGRVTSRRWDVDAPKKKVSVMPPEGHGVLTDEERRTIIEWIDTGALWNGIP